MTTLMIFVLGIIVTAITVVAVVLVGISEAADPAQSQPQDLTDWERSTVGRDRDRQTGSPE